MQDNIFMLNTVRKLIILVRHGESLGNIGLDKGKDPALSPLGRSQALKCAQYLAGELSNKVDPCKAIILSSPFLRCIQTSLIISEYTGFKVRLEPILHEFISINLFPDGVPNMPSLNQIAKANIIEGNYSNKSWLPEEHEEIDDLLLRALKFRNILVSENAEYSGLELIICISHWAMIEALLKVMCKVSVSEIRNCSISRIIYKEGRFICEFYNNYSFL